MSQPLSGECGNIDRTNVGWMTVRILFISKTNSVGVTSCRPHHAVISRRVGVPVSRIVTARVRTVFSSYWVGVIVIGGGVTAVFVRSVCTTSVGIVLVWHVACPKSRTDGCEESGWRWSSPCDCVEHWQSLMCDYDFLCHYFVMIQKFSLDQDHQNCPNPE